MNQITTEQELLAWYERQERVLTPEYLKTIPWHEVKNHELNTAFVPVLLYMRDVEKFTDLYYRELLLTPSGRDPIIRKFMDKWSVEESLHADLLNRFLEEAGLPADAEWYAKACKDVPISYRLTSTLNSLISNCFGKRFSAVHMTWGAINELSTLNGYRRLWELAKHPVLEYVLRAIAREEANHTFFYWTIAKLQIERSAYAGQLARYIVQKFWTPVGEGAKPKIASNYVIKTLFGGEEGVRTMDIFVNKKIELLPGFNGLKFIRDRIARAGAQ